MSEPYANIHHYDKNNKTVFDDDGDLCFGWYFEILSGNNFPITGMIGPYPNEPACIEAVNNGEF